MRWTYSSSTAGVSSASCGGWGTSLTSAWWTRGQLSAGQNIDGAWDEASPSTSGMSVSPLRERLAAIPALLRHLRREVVPVVRRPAPPLAGLTRWVNLRHVAQL